MAGGTIPVLNAAADLAIPYGDLSGDSALEHACIGRHGLTGGCFAVIVTDDSMEPSLCEGDYVVFAPVDVPGARAALEDGAVVFACFGDGFERGACMLARYYSAAEGVVVLRKDNTGYPPMTVSRGIIQRLAVAVERRTKLI